MFRIFLFMVTILIKPYVSTSICASVDTDPTYLVDDTKTEDVLPGCLRILPNSNNNEKYNITGLNKINASGSSQFTKSQLENLIRKLHHDMNITVIDLRQESHGFIDNTPISWYGNKNFANVNKPSYIINLDETTKLEALKQKNLIEVNQIKDKNNGIISKVTTKEIFVKNVFSEEELLNKYNILYKRFHITDHLRPNNLAVDEFIDFVKNLKTTDWLHFHCRAGGGRTTTFLAMLDIMYNSKNISLEEIIKRQYKIGGINLNKIKVAEWKQNYSYERLSFIKEFYEYCKSNNDYFNTNWSSWLNSKNLNTSTKK